MNDTLAEQNRTEQIKSKQQRSHSKEFAFKNHPQNFPRKKKEKQNSLLIMPLNQSLPIKMKRHLRIHRLHRPLLLKRNRRLEHVFLRQVEFDLGRRRRSEQVARLGRRFGKEFRHAVELGFDAIKTFGDGDGVVCDGESGESAIC